MSNAHIDQSKARQFSGVNGLKEVLRQPLLLVGFDIGDNNTVAVLKCTLREHLKNHQRSV